MKRLLNNLNLERGQIIPIVVVALIVMIGMSALILDGGGILLNRRTAQNAADAGALAGARVLCRDSNPTSNDIYNAVYQYTITENQATAFTWTVTDNRVGDVDGLAKGEVVVTVEVENESFFARIFNQDTLTAQASAGAGCFTYTLNITSPEIVLPIAYPCNLPAVGSISQDCDYHPLPWSEIEAVADNYNYDPAKGSPTTAQSRGISDDLFAAHRDKIYIVMESNELCGEGLNCNLFGNDDGRYQINSSQRGWLNLTNAPNNGNNNIMGWINNGLSEEINIPTWLNLIPGNRAVNYRLIRDNRLDELVWVPVFNDISQNGSSVQVVSFAPFFPTCVKTKGCSGPVKLDH
jgi:Flp pilus assembly protein TadG